MTTAGRQPYWILGVFIYTVLLLLIAVPFLMSYRAGTIIADIDRFADPAAKAASRIQAELSHEAAAIVGFQTTGEDKYPYLYQEQSAAIQQSLSELEQLSPNFGPAPNDNLKQARAAIEAWHSDVARNNLVKVPLPPAQFQQLLFRHEYIFEHAHETTTSLNQAIIHDVASEGQRRSIFGELALTCKNCTALVVPLITDSNPLGALFLIRPHPAYFTETEFP